MRTKRHTAIIDPPLKSPVSDPVKLNLHGEQLRGFLSSERLGHAYLVVCEEHSMKGVAIAFARLALCATREGCGTCAGCVAVAAGNHPDARFVESDGLTMGVDEIRSVRSDSLISGMMASAVVFLLLQADRMSISAANAFLKVLEEPAPGVVFGLFASRASRLPLTVVSRCQIIRLPRTGLMTVHDDVASERAQVFSQLLAVASSSSYADVFAVFAKWKMKRVDALAVCEALTMTLRDAWHAGRCPQAMLEAVEETKQHLQHDVSVSLAFDGLYGRAAALPPANRQWTDGKPAPIGKTKTGGKGR